MIKELVARHEDASINAAVDVFVPDGEDIGEAFARTTHLAIGAHPDDLEIMAYHGIAKCYGESGEWFCGVTCTDGAGSSRVGPYAKYTDLEMVAIRQEEQRQAAMVGKYAAMVQLCLPSSAIKEPGGALLLKDDLADILKQTRPEVVYTHNPADKHSTHIAVLQGAIRAMHTLAPEARPKLVYGCEVWRDLDWLPDEDKVVLDVSQRENLANALVGVYDSQITGGKRYDRAAVGRRYANATFFYAKARDKIEQVTFAMDLTPLVQDESIDLTDYVMGYINKFGDDVRSKLERYFSH